jgi:hypothetical protein
VGVPLEVLLAFGGGGQNVYTRDILILNEIRAEDKIYTLLDTLLGWNMRLALFYKLNFTKVCVNLEMYIIH